MNAFIQCRQGAKVHNKFSVILMDREGEHILREVSLQGEEDKESLFLRDVVVDEDDEWRMESFGQMTIFDIGDGSSEDTDDGEDDGDGES